MRYAERLRLAIEHSKLTQAEVATRAGTSQQVVSAMLNRGSDASTYTTQLAKACGVSPDWLATGKGKMLVEEERAHYDAGITGEAAEIARAYMKLSPTLKASVRTMIFSMASAQSVAPWLVIETPKGDGYAAWEKAIQTAYDAEVKQMKLDFGR